VFSRNDTRSTFAITDSVDGKDDMDFLDQRYEHLAQRLEDLHRQVGDNQQDHKSEKLLADLNAMQIEMRALFDELRSATGQHSRVDERKQQTEQMEYQSHLLEYVHDAIIATDPEFTITFWNKAAEELYGWTAAEVIGRKLSDVIKSDLLHSELDSTLQMLMMQGHYRYDVAQMTRSGERIYVDATGVILTDEPGNITGYLSATRDITARKQAEARALSERARAEKLAAESKQRAVELDAVFKSLAEGVIVYNPEGVVIRANPAAVQITELDLIGLSRMDLVAKLNIQDERGQQISYLDLPATTALQGMQVIDRRFCLIKHNNEEAYFSVSASPLPHDDDEPVGAVAIWHNITGQMNAEKRQARLLEENRRQSDLLEQLVSQAPTGIAFLDGPEHRYTMVNPAYMNIARGKGEIIGRTVGEVFSEVAGEFIPILDNVFHTSEIYQAVDIPYTIERKGVLETNYFSFSCVPLFGEQNRVKGIVILSNETTEQARARQQIEDERARLRAIFEYAPSGIMVTDREARVTMTNPEADRIFGRPVPYGEAYAAHAQLEICYPDGQPVPPRELPLTRATLDGEVNINLELAIRLPDGTLRPVLINTTPIRGRRGRVTGAVAVFQDITDRKRAEQQLHESEARFQLALKNSPISVYTTDQELRYTWVHNPPWGLTPAQLIGKRDDEIFPFDQVEMMMTLKQRVMETRNGERQEIALQLNKKTLVFDMTAEPLYTAGGEIEGLTVAAVDVTEQRQLEAEMQRSAMRIQMQHYLTNQRELERMQIARDLHDGPLQDLIAITFGMQTVVDEAEGTPLSEYLLQIQNELQVQIANLRSFSYELRPPMLNNFTLERTIRSHAEGFAEKYPRLQIHLDLKPDDQKRLPDAVRTALFRIYQEALTNFVKHAKADEVYVRLEVGDEIAQLEVLDKGAGFEVPNDWLTMARKGHLGLVGIQERVDAVGGKMKIASHPGQGTQLVVTVPYLLDVSVR
jgi:PAS domain S-box-containing protein